MVSYSPLVSVVIPSYNPGKKIRDCIKSIIRQSYTNLEIIVIDDCSTDNSTEWIEKLKDQRINIIRNPENQGEEKSRIYGFEIAKGEYVMSVDADDWLTNKNVIQHMVNKIEETETDYVEIGMRRCLNKWLYKDCEQSITGIIEQPKLFDDYYLSFFGYNLLRVNIWGKLYRRSSLISLDPYGLKMGPDLYFNLMQFPNFKKIYLMDEIGYGYRTGGMTSKYNPRLYPDLEKLFLKKLDLIAQYNYQKADFFAWSEIKNVFRSEVIQLIAFRPSVISGEKNSNEKGYPKSKKHKIQDQKHQILDRIADLCSRPYWAEYRAHVPEPDVFALLILAKDAEAIYRHCLPLARQATRSRRLKSILYH